MAMTDHKRAKKDTRSSITVQLSAAHADFVVELLARELDNTHREGQTNLTVTIQDILNLFRDAIELEEKKRALRGQTSEKERDAKKPSRTENRMKRAKSR